MKKFLVVSIMVLILVSACGPKPVPVVSQNGIEVYAPTARAVNASETTAAYMLVKNTGSEPDMLLTAACDTANMVEVMNTQMEGDMMSMSETKGIEIPAGASVELKSGSYHIMLMDLKEDLKAGGTVSVTLVFEKAGTIVVEVPVTAP